MTSGAQVLGLATVGCFSPWPGEMAFTPAAGNTGHPAELLRRGGGEQEEQVRGVGGGGGGARWRKRTLGEVEGQERDSALMGHGGGQQRTGFGKPQNGIRKGGLRSIQEGVQRTASNGIA